MKPVVDKEIDALLRRSPAKTLWAEGGSASNAAREQAHLDADELNAYAENALPSAARTRFASHLADCDECRNIVIELSRSADAAGTVEKRVNVVPDETVHVRAAWRAWLGALFAPGVLRYAVPLVALFIVGALTLIALRTRRDDRQSAAPATQGGSNPVETPTEVASGTLTGGTPLEGTTGDTATTRNNSQTDKPAPSSSTANANSNTSITVDGVSEIAQNAPPPSPLPANGRMTENEIAANKSQPKTEPAQPPVSATAGAVVPPSETAIVARAETQKSAMQESAERKQRTRDEAASAAEAARVDSLSRSDNQVRQAQNAQSPDGSRGGAQRSASNSAGGGPASSSATAPASREARATRRSRETDAESADKKEKPLATEETETRAVSGHRFQRRDGAWVDANYKPSMAMTGVRRNTEGYRALIADIPELGRIADQLGGEIVVVVKGRAYRIR